MNNDEVVLNYHSIRLGRAETSFVAGSHLGRKPTSPPWERVLGPFRYYIQDLHKHQKKNT